MEKPVLIVMAAGMGSRYGGLKQMDPVGPGGELILDYSIYDAREAGFRKVIFVIKKEIEEDFRELMKSRNYPDMEIEYAFQEIGDLPEGYEVPEGRAKPWGTCHAVLSCRKLVRGPFAVINADDYYGREAFVRMYRYLEDARDDEYDRYAMIGYALKNTLTENGHVARGVCQVSREGFLEEITERTRIQRNNGEIQYADEQEQWHPLSEDTLVSMNFWGFTLSAMGMMEELFPSVLDRILVENPLKGEYYLPFAVDHGLKNGRATVKVLPSADRWYGVTYLEDKPSVMAAMKDLREKGLYPERLW